MGIWRSASWTYTMPRVVRNQASAYTPSVEASLSAACVSAAPTLLGSDDAMLAKMRMEVPLPSFSSVMASATCSQLRWTHSPLTTQAARPSTVSNEHRTKARQDPNNHLRYKPHSSCGCRRQSG